MKQILSFTFCLLLISCICSYGQVKKPVAPKATSPAKQTVPNNQEDTEKGQIVKDAKEQLRLWLQLLNIVSKSKSKNQSEAAMQNIYGDGGFIKDDNVQIENDINPDFNANNYDDLRIGEYLSDLYLNYSKKNTNTIVFSNIQPTVDIGKKTEDLYKFTIYYQSHFQDKNFDGKSYQPTDRIAEFEAKKSLNGVDWNVVITGIRFLPNATTVATKIPEIFKSRETPPQAATQPQVAKKEEPKPPIITEKKDDKPAIAITEKKEEAKPTVTPPPVAVQKNEEKPAVTIAEKKEETKPTEEKPFLVTERKEDAKEGPKLTPTNAIVAPEKTKVLVSMAPDDPVAAQKAQALQAQKAAEQLKKTLNKPSEPDLSGRARTAAIIKIVLAGAAAAATVTTFMQLQKAYTDYKTPANTLNQNLNEWQSLSRRTDVGKPLEVVSFNNYAKPGVYGVYGGAAATIGLTFSALQSLGKARANKGKKK